MDVTSRRIHVPPPNSRRSPPESWSIPMSALLRKAHGDVLQLEDLPSVNEKHKSTVLMRGHKWKDEKRIIVSLVMKFWKTFALASFFRLCSIFADFGSILLLKYLIDATESSASLFTFFIISVLILFFILLKSVSFGIHTYLVSQDSTLVGVVLNSLIVKKSLSLSAASEIWTPAKVTKLVATHSEAISSALIFVHHSWASAIELTIVLIWIWETLGTQTILGVALVTVLFMSLNLVVTSYYRKFQKQQMVKREEKLDILKETLSSIEVIKVFTYEQAFIGRLLNARNSEMKYLRFTMLVNRLMHSFNTSAPFLVMMVSFTTYGILANIDDLRFEDAFVMIAIFNYMRRPLATILPSLQFLSNAFYSAARINAFLNFRQSPNLVPSSRASEKVGIHLENAYFSWDDSRDHLEDVNFEVNQGEVHSIIGLPGSGKTSLLFAILGELKVTKGLRKVSGKLGFVPYQPFVFAQTVKANILFGNPYEKPRYDAVVSACDLRKDIFAFPRCEATVVGEKVGREQVQTEKVQIQGFPLTETQKAQISLARCLYDDPEILVLDKPFATMDRATAKRIYQRLFADDGLLKSKTVVWATSNTDFAQRATKIHLFDGGKIVKSGSLDDVCHSEVFKELEKRHVEEHHPPPSLLESSSVRSKKKKTVMFEVEKASERKRQEVFPPVQSPWKNLYIYYIKCFSCQMLTCMVSFLIFRYFVQATTFFWLAYWLEPKSREAVCPGCTQFTFLQIFCILALTAVALNACAYYFSIIGNIRASKKMFHDVVEAIFRLPYVYFDENTRESILTIMTTNLDESDVVFPLYARFFIETVLNMLMIVAIVVANMPIYTIFVIAFALFYFFMLAKETLLTAYEEIDRLTRSRLAQLSAFRWLSFRLELVANLMIFSCLVMASICQAFGVLSAPRFALSVASILCLSDLVTSSLRILCHVETSAQAVDRVSQTENFPREQTYSEEKESEHWQPGSAIEVENLNVFLKKEKHVLKDVTMKIEAGEKVGMIGKYGAGKSSFIYSLVRMNNADDESIIRIDEIDISKYSTSELRTKITIVPQKLMVFSGTIRFNIDPLYQFADSDLWLALEAVHLKRFVQDLPKGLDQEITEADLSLEQRQQINVCRGLLRTGCQIYVFDQSMEFMGQSLRHLLNETIQEMLRPTTVISITEDLEDVADADRVAVFDEGCLVCLDTPQIVAQLNAEAEKTL
ncbi:unnamed protein product [Caenorhabditis auriculariae]|uniref:Uncharacterized protein n=1 Tax=Caenorhabditis auriculariae TaxID=2777116 RepID=A0A8S1HBG6_9PELO|nr:unnamed protein product [Caenorhabditis auriculariae]